LAGIRATAGELGGGGERAPNGQPAREQIGTKLRLMSRRMAARWRAGWLAGSFFLATTRWQIHSVALTTIIHPNQTGSKWNPKWNPVLWAQQY